MKIYLEVKKLLIIFKQIKKFLWCLILSYILDFIVFNLGRKDKEEEFYRKRVWCKYKFDCIEN